MLGSDELPEGGPLSCQSCLGGLQLPSSGVQQRNHLPELVLPQGPQTAALWWLCGMVGAFAGYVQDAFLWCGGNCLTFVWSWPVKTGITRQQRG